MAAGGCPVNTPVGAQVSEVQQRIYGQSMAPVKCCCAHYNCFLEEESSMHQLSQFLYLEQIFPVVSMYPL